MGVADTSWVMQRKRMSQTADILLTGRDMDDRTLHLREENCVWTLEDEETAEEREIKAVPDYLWKAAKYIESVGKQIQDNDTFTVTCLAIPKHMEAYPADDNIVFDGGNTSVDDTWTGYISDGDAVLAEPEDYMTLR